MKKHIFWLAFSQLLFVGISVSAQSLSGAYPDADEYLNRLFADEALFDTSRVYLESTATAKADETWKSWHTVENYYYGKNRGPLPMIADLRALHPYFRDRIMELIRVCKASGIELAIVESYRTPAKQAEYFAMGRKYTSSPGGKSRHQYGLAVDVVPIVDSRAVWNDRRLWRKIGQAGERLGLRWGGRWRVTYDPGHFEWSGGLSRRALEAGEMPEVPASFADQYPALADDLAGLERSWQAWSVEQSTIANNRVEEADDATAGVGN
jgi:hypothetical protein